MTNKEIADRLRKIADHIEECPRDRHIKIVPAGGEPKVHAIWYGRDLVHVPLGFEPVGAAIFIGDADFVRTASVTNEQNTPWLHQPKNSIPR